MKKTLLSLSILLNLSFFNFSYAKFDIKARTVILQDFLSGEILFEKEADYKIYPASMTKIMTSIIVFDLLKENNIDILEKIKFPDHYNYTKEDLEKLINKAKSSGSMLLTTEKDFFRIDVSYRKKIEHLKIKIEIENKKLFIEEIKKVI